MSDWKVELVNDNISELNVEFKGPPDSESVCKLYVDSSACTARIALQPACALQVPTQGATGESMLSCRRHTPTSPPQLASATEYTTQMWMRRKPDVCHLTSLHPWHAYALVSCPCASFLLQSVPGDCLIDCAFDSMYCCRAGSVCLDVINQTWSPMFGKSSVLSGWQVIPCTCLI